MKRILFGILSCLILILCCGCTASYTEQELPTEDRIELMFFSQKREIEDFFNEVIEEYNASQDSVRVVHVHNPYTEQYIRIHAAQNTLPDIIQIAGIQDARTAYYVEKNMFLPLTHFESVNYVEEIYKSITRYRGEIYTIPVSANFICIYVNMDLLTSYGLELPDTWDKWLEELAYIKENGKEALLITDGDGWSTQSIFNSMIFSAKAENYNYEQLVKVVATGESAFEDNEIFCKALERLQEIHEYANEDYLKLSYDDAIKRFCENEAVFFCQGSWALPSILKENPNLNVQAIPLPIDQYKVGLSMDMSLAIGRNCQHREEAEKFLEFLISPEIAQRYADFDCSISCVEGVEDGGEAYFKRVYDEIEKGNYAHETIPLPNENYDFLAKHMIKLFYRENPREISDFVAEYTKIFQTNIDEDFITFLDGRNLKRVRE